MNLQGTLIKVFLLLILVILTGSITANTDDICIPEVDDTNNIEFFIDNLRFTASPNPFEDYTVLTVYVSESIRGSITIKDRLGNTVNNLYSGLFKLGDNYIMWNGADDYGFSLDAGSYLCELHFEDRYTSRTIILILK
ncbi:MAG: hypothetical protein K0B81_06320 [Candidatus Cloacimonetes bacterium]|nr:hypothetical protein [Candidatus Cloacimonadota bacterium]